jgi:hypothetical protein
MAVPRPLLLALLGVLLLGATFFATRNAREATSDPAPTAAQQSQPAPKPKSKPHASKASAQPKPAKESRSADKPKRARPASQSLSKPAAVARAIARRRVVVLGFFQPGADDRASAAAVAGVRDERGVVVFVDRIANVGRYGPIVQSVGIEQAPAIVIVDSKRRARVIQGYVDSETLAQEVRDVRG